jgi:hypothetical protein
LTALLFIVNNYDIKNIKVGANGCTCESWINPLIKGYPVGTMLFYETYEDNKRMGRQDFEYIVS